MPRISKFMDALGWLMITSGLHIDHAPVRHPKKASDPAACAYDLGIVSDVASAGRQHRYQLPFVFREFNPQLRCDRSRRGLDDQACAVASD